MKVSSVHLDFPEAHALADLEGIRQDLEWIKSAKDFFDELKDSDATLREALFYSVIIKYGRVFKGGIRKKLPQEFIESLNADEIKRHKFFLDVRDKFIAHSVNDFELNHPLAYINNLDSENPEFNQVHVAHERILSLGKKFIHELVDLADILLKKLNELFVIEKENVEKIARKIPIEDLKRIKPKKSKFSLESAGRVRHYKNK
ncbi:MAG: hypothetical protein ABII75_07180 [Candidatus Omnitrophota bacterium]